VTSILTLPDSVPFPDMESRRLDRLLPHQAETIGDRVWLMSGSASLTFAEAHAQVEAYAAGFAERGVGPGDVVAVLMDTGIEYVLVVLALTRLNAVHVPINTAFKGEFLRRLLERAEPRAVVVGEAYDDQLLGGLPEDLKPLIVTSGPVSAQQAYSPTPHSRVHLAELAESTKPAPVVRTRHDDVIAIGFTSGTTGRSKGVVLTHHYWLCATEAMNTGRDVRADDVFYSCTPMFHTGAWLLNVYPSLITGRPLGIDPWFSVTDFWSSVHRFKATQLFTLGAMHMWLWQQPPVPEETGNPGRIWAAVPLPTELAGPFRERFGLDGVFNGYGQTEIMPATIAAVDGTWKPGSCGVAQPYLELRAVDDQDREVPAGEVGELVVRPKTPNSMFSGYFKMPEETLEAFRNLWYHTGDLVRIDADGELFFVDRKADYLRRRGENVSSLEVEEVLRAHPSIADVAVYGVPAPDSEDEIKASLVPADGQPVDFVAVAEYAAENLPYFAVPRYLELIDELPRTPTGRVQKYLLRQAGPGDAWDAVAAGFSVSKPSKPSKPGRRGSP
jgi:crotonobetaine/carnitine-CoA ligase